MTSRPPIKLVPVDVWIDIRNEYVAGYETTEDGRILRPTIRELSERYNISHSTMTKRCDRENWTNLRRAHWDRVEQERLSLQVEQLSRDAVKFNLNAIETAKLGVNEIMKHFTLHNQRTPGEVMHHNKLKALGEALERFQKVGRLSLGQSTDNGEQMIWQKPSVSLEEMSFEELEQLEKLVEAQQARSYLKDERTKALSAKTDEDAPNYEEDATWRDINNDDEDV